MQQGDICNYTIQSLNNEGEGIVRTPEEKFVVFIPDALPGENVDCRIITKKKNYAIGKVLKRYNESPDRTVPACKAFYKCGGCQLLHMSYKAQLEMKKNSVYDSLERIGGISEPNVMDCEPSPNTMNYRNKASLPVQQWRNDNFVGGFYKTRSHDIVPFSSCPVLDKKLDEKIRKVFDLLKRNGFSGVSLRKDNKLRVKHIVARQTAYSDKSLCAIIVNRKPSKRELSMITAIIENNKGLFDCVICNVNDTESNFIWGEHSIHIYGEETIYEKLGDFTFEFEASSFFQVNSGQTVNLYKEAKKAAVEQRDKTILELYSGVGSLTAFLAEASEKVTAVESWEPAAKYLLNNMKRNNLFNVESYTGKAEEIVGKLKDRVFDVIVMDPPRTGCQAEVLDFIKEKSPEKVVYVSCNPATLARDLKLLSDMYTLKYAKPFDMFPQTSHVETVVLMSRKDK